MSRKITHAVILAAGPGTRLKPITDHSPKCLTEVNRTPILMNILECLEATGIQNCTVVTGFLSLKVVEAIGSRFRKISVDYIKNDIYESTNDMYSLWLAREVMEQGAIIFEGDIFIRSETLLAALRSMGDRSFYITGKYNGKPDEIEIKTDPSLQIRSINVLRGGKAGKPERFKYMSSGIIVLQPEYGKQLSRWLGEWVSDKRVNVLFDDVIAEHIASHPLWIYEIGWDEWVEIDTVEDLRRAETLF